MLGEVSRGCWWGRGWASQWCGRRGPPRRPLDKGDGAREGAAHLWAVPARPAPACAPVLRTGCLAVGASVDEGWRQARARPPVLLAPRSPAAGRGPERRGPVASVRTSARSSAWRCLWPCRPSDRLARDECWGGGALRARRGCAPTCPSGSSGPFRAPAAPPHPRPFGPAALGRRRGAGFSQPPGVPVCGGAGVQLLGCRGDVLWGPSAAPRPSPETYIFRSPVVALGLRAGETPPRVPGPTYPSVHNRLSPRPVTPSHRLPPMAPTGLAGC